MKLITVVLIFLVYLQQKLHSAMERICYAPPFMRPYASIMDTILEKQWHLVLSPRLRTDHVCPFSCLFCICKERKEGFIEMWKSREICITATAMENLDSVPTVVLFLYYKITLAQAASKVNNHYEGKKTELYSKKELELVTYIPSDCPFWITSVNKNMGVER